jgi:CheY-like chemotaxis protein
LRQLFEPSVSEVVLAPWNGGWNLCNTHRVNEPVQVVDLTPGGVTRVLVTDDHAPYRHSIASLLSLYDEFDVVGEAASVEEALEQVIEHRVDLVLLDVHMPGTDGVTGAHLMLDADPEVHIMLCSTSDRDAIGTLPESTRAVFVSKADLDPEVVLGWRRSWNH